MVHGSGTWLSHPAEAALREVDAGLDGLVAANLWSLPDADLLELRVAQERTLARLQSTILATTREIDGRGAATATGAHSTAGWLRGRLLVHPGAAKAEVALAAGACQLFCVRRRSGFTGRARCGRGRRVRAGRVLVSS